MKRWKSWKVETLKSWNIENLKSFGINDDIVEKIKIWKLKVEKSFSTNDDIVEKNKKFDFFYFHNFCWNVKIKIFKTWNDEKKWNIENLKSWTFVFTISTEIVRIKIWKLKVEKSFGTNNVIVENLKCWKVETLKRWNVEKLKSWKV